jgi:hypothetical protein
MDGVDVSSLVARKPIAAVNLMMRRLLKVVAGVLVAGVLFFIGLAYITRVHTDLTAEDIMVFEEIGLATPRHSLSFEEQVAQIKILQAKLFQRAPMGEGIPFFQAREPADLMLAGKGLCYDRSRFLDKGGVFLGMETRHVYLLYKQDKPFWRAIFSPGQASHAVTEIRTHKGWMFVDSNTAWVALTRTGEPVGADDVWRRFEEFENPPLYLKESWWAIRGMYSRKGQFYKPYLLFPEFNWPDFLSWLVRG